MTLHNKTFVVKRSLNYAKLDELHYVEMTYYKVEQLLVLQKGARANVHQVIYYNHYYKVGQIYYKVGKLYKVGH